MQKQAADLGLSQHVHFIGKLDKKELAIAYNQHQVNVIPSRWEEPFGLVAIEGLACACIPIAAAVGGLPEAVGPCGILFPKGEPLALAKAIETMLQSPELQEKYREGAPLHLAKHQPLRVAQQYIDLFTTPSTA